LIALEVEEGPYVDRSPIFATENDKFVVREPSSEAEIAWGTVNRPMDAATIIGSVRKTHRAVVVEAGAGFAGMGSEIASFITEQAFDDLDAPVERVTGANAPMPYARNLERLKTPTKERIVEAVRRVCYANGGRS
jgi:pyruvate dehydrogenase E1 component beta subunit